MLIVKYKVDLATPLLKILYKPHLIRVKAKVFQWPTKLYTIQLPDTFVNSSSSSLLLAPSTTATLVSMHFFKHNKRPHVSKPVPVLFPPPHTFFPQTSTGLISSPLVLCPRRPVLTILFRIANSTLSASTSKLP